MKHLFVDISAHGFGHLAQTAPVLNALLDRRPLRLTIRSGLSRDRLSNRIRHPFTHLHAASDFGFVMRDALTVDRDASAERYRAAYADWPVRVADEAQQLIRLQPDLVLSNVSPLPLAGAARAGMRAVAMSSLNWADLFAHYYSDAAWAAPIHAVLHDAYAGAAAFLRLTPGMPMDDLPNLKIIGPVSARTDVAPTLRAHLARTLNLPLDKRWLLVALGGIAHRLPVEAWPEIPGVHLLVPADWDTAPRSDITAYDETTVAFLDLFSAADAILGKPGYGTFVEAACLGIPVLYLQRPDWPESACLEDWLRQHARSAVVEPAAAARGDIGDTLATLLASPAAPHFVSDGVAEAVHILDGLLDGPLDAAATMAA